MPNYPTFDELDDDHVQAVMFDSEFDEAPDGCTVYELDGTCPHGQRGIVAHALGV